MDSKSLAAPTRAAAGVDRGEGEAMTAALDFADEDTNPEARVAFHPTVTKWCEDMVQSARHFHERGGCTADVVADFERLLAMAKGEQ